MSDEELERLRPPNVSMNTMRAWSTIRGIAHACASVFAATLVLSYGLQSPWVALAIPGAALALALVAWSGILVFGFVQYSLRTLLLAVLLTGGLLTGFSISAEFEQKLHFGTYLVLWASFVVLYVLDFDPLHRAKLAARRKKAAAKEPRE